MKNRSKNIFHTAVSVACYETIKQQLSRFNVETAPKGELITIKFTYCCNADFEKFMKLFN